MSDENFFIKLKNFFMDSVRENLKSYLKIFARYGLIAIAAIIVVYLILFIAGWDVFYETDIPFMSIFIFTSSLFFILFIASFVISFILYSTKYTRRTKYASKKEKAEQ